jgi:tRNA (cytidine/uridine-2'-O-)-methyltransferase
MESDSIELAEDNFTARRELPQVWPEPALEIVLVEPQIPPNTGTIARLCAATGSRLHLVEPLGFQLTSQQLKRAGLDYWDSVDITRHRNLEEFLQAQAGRRMFLYSTRAGRKYTAVLHRPGDMLVFGSETKGLPADFMRAHKADLYGLPMRLEHVRSLNLACSTAIVLYEALRQIDRAF